MHRVKLLGSVCLTGGKQALLRVLIRLQPLFASIEKCVLADIIFVGHVICGYHIVLDQLHCGSMSGCLVHFVSDDICMYRLDVVVTWMTDLDR